VQFIIRTKAAKDGRVSEATIDADDAQQAAARGVGDGDVLLSVAPKAPGGSDRGRVWSHPAVAAVLAAAATLGTTLYLVPKVTEKVTSSALDATKEMGRSTERAAGAAQRAEADAVAAQERLKTTQEKLDGLVSKLGDVENTIDQRAAALQQLDAELATIQEGAGKLAEEIRRAGQDPDRISRVLAMFSTTDPSQGAVIAKLDTVARRVQEADARPVVQFGHVSAKANSKENWVVKGSGASRYYLCDVEVKFKTPFSAPPEVYTALNGFELSGNGKNERLTTSVTKVTKDGFVLRYHSSGPDVVIGRAGASWIAMGPQPESAAQKQASVTPAPKVR
jgi:hypothetical protein